MTRLPSGSFDPAPRLLRAAWVAPMTGAPMPDGAVVIDGGYIQAVGPARDLERSHPAAARHDLGSVVLMPGLVNAHTHLELSTFTPGPEPASFTHWLLRLMAQRKRVAVPEDVLRATRTGIAQCLRFGVTTVGDITSEPRLTRPVLRNSLLRAISYGEVRAMGTRRASLALSLAEAADTSQATDNLMIGVSPHAPYSVEVDGYRAAVNLAKARQVSLTTHLAESVDETAFLANHAGPLRRIWDWLGAWDENVPTFSGGPIRFAQSVGLLDLPALLAHVNYCDDAELDLLAKGRASVVYCPRTHAWFGHPPHRWREMLGRGINVAVGTDSCASSPDLNLVDDLRLLRRIAPEMAPLTIWQMATVRAARALGLERKVGSLARGMAADLVAFPVSGDDPLAEVLDQAVHPAGVWIAGQRQD